MKIRINKIIYNRSLVDGPGVRSVIFFQGCNIHCEGCHNKDTWDICGGQEYSVEALAADIKANSVNKKITISGGEPLLQEDALFELLSSLEGFDIVLYTGHILSDVPSRILQKVKYIKTGSFEHNKRTTVMPFVGSSNQSFQRVDEVVKK